MIKSSEAYKKAIVADYRRVEPYATVDIVSPDVELTGVDTQAAPYCEKNQVFDRVFNLSEDIITLEHNRWILNGEMLSKTMSEPIRDTETGLVLSDVSDEHGEFQADQVISVLFDGISTLQLCSLFFSDRNMDSVPKDFKVEIMQGGNVYFTEEITENISSNVLVDNFDVKNVDEIRITVYSTVIPYRRVRIAEVYPGIYEQWSGDEMKSLSIKYQGDFSTVSIPYGTCEVEFDNSDLRFEYRKKDSLFRSIEERQSITFYTEIKTEYGYERKPVGVFYQFEGGWRTSENAATIKWSLVDIIGLLSGRRYIVPEALPKTLEEWVKSIVSQLGENFSSRYIVDSQIADIPLTATSKKISGKTCGEILLDVCMVTNSWPRADGETGKLAVEPLWSQGNEISLDNMLSYPSIQANDDVATITFTLNDEDETQYTVSGNNSTSSNSLSIENPFITTKEEALSAAKTILRSYGGDAYKISYRGDPSSEIGDVQTIQLDESSAVSARLKEHSLSFDNGVLSGSARLIQPTGQSMFENSVTLTESGQWTSPRGVTSLYIILVGHGSDGADGTDGTWDEDGEDGSDGLGGMIWFGTIPVNDQQVFDVDISENATFGPYSSADGQRYDPSFTDLGNGNTYGRTGVKNPIDGYGDGGAGGKGGKKGNKRFETAKKSDGTLYSRTVIDNYPGEAEKGHKGAKGRVVIWWNK